MSLRDHLKYAMFYNLSLFLAAILLSGKMVIISALVFLFLNMISIVLEILDVSKKVTMAMVLVSHGGFLVNIPFFLYEIIRYGS